MSSRRFLLRRVWHLAIPTPPAMGYSPTEYAEFTEPPAEKSLPRISQICTDVRVRCSPTEFTEFTEPPTEMSSHGFHRFTQILRVRCSPTEYAEFTEPPTEMSSHGFHRFTQILRVRCSPTEYAEFTEPPTEMSSHGFHRFTQILRVRCSPTEFTEYTEFGSVGMAGMPYPPTSVRIRVICGRLFSARSFRAFRAFCGNIFPPTDFTDLHRYLGCAVLPQNSQNTQNLAAWVWQGCHTLLHLCASVPSVGGSSQQEVLCIRCIPWELLHRLFCWCSSCSGKRQSRAETAALPGLAAWVWQGCHTLLHLCVPCVLWESFLCKRFCVFGVFRGSFFTICFVGAAETAAPPGGIHGSSVHISPPHHLTTTTPFHLEPSLLHVLPELWVRLRHHLRLVDAQPGEHDCRRCERHRHAVVVVRVDRL